MIKGVVVAASGAGFRLAPMTVETSKFVLPICERPMVHFPLECLARSGVEDVLVVTDPSSAGDLIRTLDDGRDFGLRTLRYVCRDEPGGAADALALAEEFAEGSPLIVVQGDNIVERAIAGPLWDYRRQGTGARILLTPVAEPELYPVAVFEDGSLLRIVDMPEEAPSDLIVVGMGMYDANVFDVIRGLEPSDGGGREMTDLNNAYLERGELASGLLEGWWVEAGASPDDYQAACMLVARDGANHQIATGRHELRPTG